MKAPFPYFGGKSKVASLVWEALGNVANYVEPFAGSLAVLLSRPTAPKVETVNDMDGFVSNFWRAVSKDPDQVAHHADWPVSECDLHARHLWLLGQRENITERLMGDPDYFDSKVAGWWCWGMCCSIAGWCDGKGGWVSIEGKFVKRDEESNDSPGVSKGLPHQTDAGCGITRGMPHASNLGRGLMRGEGASDRFMYIKGLFEALRTRLREVRVACGDWSRVCGPSVLKAARSGRTGVFLDPPYLQSMRSDVYACESNVNTEILAWCKEHQSDEDTRIVLAGYEGEYDLPGWLKIPWKSRGGYGVRTEDGRGQANRSNERLWLSPQCSYPRKSLQELALLEKEAAKRASKKQTEDDED